VYYNAQAGVSESLVPIQQEDNYGKYDIQWYLCVFACACIFCSDCGMDQLQKGRKERSVSSAMHVRDVLASGRPCRITH